MRISDWSSDVCSSDLSAHAMNWCGLLDTIPREQGDFEKLSGSVEALTGCGSQPSDSAHQAIWACSDDTATEEYEGVHISLFSEPRSEERRVGKECVSPCSSRWWPYH